MSSGGREETLDIGTGCGKAVNSHTDKQQQQQQHVSCYATHPAVTRSANDCSSVFSIAVVAERKVGHGLCSKKTVKVDNMI